MLIKLLCLASADNRPCRSLSVCDEMGLCRSREQIKNRVAFGELSRIFAHFVIVVVSVEWGGCGRILYLWNS